MKQKNDTSLICDSNVDFIYFINIFVDLTMALTYFYVFTACKSVSIDIDICGTNSNVTENNAESDIRI